MKLFVVVAALVLAGCAEPEPATELAPETAQQSPEATPSIGRLELVIDLPEPTLGANTITGATNKEASVSAVLIDGDQRSTVANLESQGPFSFEVELPYGQTTLEISADDGVDVATKQLLFTIFAPGIMGVEFEGSLDRAAIREAALLDIDAFPSAAMYEGCAAEHPGHANVHDFMVAWSNATGIEIVYSDCSEFGFLIETIDGYDSPGDWCYTVNGEAAPLGITGQAWQPDDDIVWNDCVLVFA